MPPRHHRPSWIEEQVMPDRPLPENPYRNLTDDEVVRRAASGGYSDVLAVEMMSRLKAATDRQTTSLLASQETTNKLTTTIKTLTVWLVVLTVVIVALTIVMAWPAIIALWPKGSGR